MLKNNKNYIESNTEFDDDQYINTSSFHVIGISDFLAKLAVVTRAIFPDGSDT